MIQTAHATTIICVRRGQRVAMAGDGQVTLGQAIVKGNATKIRKMRDGAILAGFAGAAADAFTLFELFEAELEKRQANLQRAAVELAKTWRTERALRRLEALLAVADKNCSLLISGNGDVIEPERDVLAIGSGAGYAQAAARALLAETDLDSAEVATKALSIAAEICIYTNDNISLEVIEG